MAAQRKIPERFWCVKQIHIFGDLTEDDADALKRITTFKTLKHGEPVSDEGVYLLKEGRIKIYETPTEGEPTTLEVMEPGEIFGAIEWDDNAAHRNITAETLTAAVVGIVSSKKFPILSETEIAFCDAVQTTPTGENPVRYRCRNPQVRRCIQMDTD